MSRQLTVYVTLFLSILLFGCTSREAPAPVSSLDNKVKPATRKVNISGSKYVVKKGDTLYSIAFSAQQDFRTLAKINDIPAPYTIFPGQSISLTKSAQKSKKTKKYTNSSKKSTVSIQKNNKKLKKGLDQPKQREYVQKQAKKIISEKKAVILMPKLYGAGLQKVKSQNASLIKRTALKDYRSLINKGLLF